jgi:hypothetical protein
MVAAGADRIAEDGISPVTVARDPASPGWSTSKIVTPASSGIRPGATVQPSAENHQLGLGCARTASSTATVRGTISSAGWDLPLADDLFLAMLDTATYRLRVRGRQAGVALAGALLAELVLTGYLAARHDRVWSLGTAPPDCDLAAGIVAEMAFGAARDPDLALCDWLEYLGRVAEKKIAARVEKRGIISASSTWTIRGEVPTY